MTSAAGYFKTTPIAEYIAKLNKEFFEGDLLCPVVSVDDGYAQNNAAVLVIEGTGDSAVLKIIEDKIPSLARRGRHTSAVIGGAVNLYGVVESNEEYTVSEWVQSPEDTRTPDYSTTTLNLSLIHHMLNRLGLAGENVALLTGLPLEQYMDGEEGTNTILLEKKKKNLLRDVYVGPRKEPSAKVVFAGIYPEAVAGIVDYMIDEYGDMKPGVNPDVVRLGLDIGGNTTDMAIVLPGNQLGAKKTLEYGVTHVKDRLRQLLMKRFECEPDDTLLEEALMTKRVSWFGGDPEDVTAEVGDAIGCVMQPILAEVDLFKRRFPSLKEIIGFGGGVALMENLIRDRYPNIIVLDNADGANARGFLKCALLYDLDTIMSVVHTYLNASSQVENTEPAIA